MARAIRSPRFHPRVVRSKRAYSRKVKHGRPHLETREGTEGPG
jgi:hypothetical protein